MENLKIAHTDQNDQNVSSPEPSEKSPLLKKKLLASQKSAKDDEPDRIPSRN